MCANQRGLVSKTEGDNMTTQAGHRGGGSQLHPNQDSVKNKATRESGLSCLRALLQVLRSICFWWPLVFLYLMTFMQTHAHGEEQTGICQLMDPAIIFDMSSVVNFETIGLCSSSSTEQFPKQRMNTCVPQGHVNAGNRLPDPWGSQIPSRAYVKEHSCILLVVMTVVAIIGGIGLVGWMLYKCRRAFTEADINRGLASEPAVPRRSDRTFEIPPNIHGIAN